jgi:hypothetical protein
MASNELHPSQFGARARERSPGQPRARTGGVGVCRVGAAWRGAAQRVTTAPVLGGDRENGGGPDGSGASWAAGGSRPELGRKGEAG